LRSCCACPAEGLEPGLEPEDVVALLADAWLALEAAIELNICPSVR
jgi:hypothetical protein